MTYRSDYGQPDGAYQPGRSDPLGAAAAMAQAGVLTQAAARAIAHFSERGVADCGWDGATAHGWVTYRGVLYSPRGFSALIASDTDAEDPRPCEASEPSEADDDDEPLLLPAAARANPIRLTWSEQLHAALELVSALALFAVSLIATAVCVGWVVIQGLAQLAAMLVSGLASLIAALLGQ